MKKIHKIRSQEFKTSLEPEELFSNFSPLPYSALLCGKGSSDNSRYAFIGINPFHIIKPKKDLFKTFQQHLEFYSVKSLKYPENLWGALGYISYDAAHHIENLPKTTKNDLKMPDLVMIYYKDFIIYDFQEKKQFLIQVQLENDEFSDADQILNNFDSIERTFKADKKVIYEDEKTYLKKINKIKEYIKDGDVYEVCLSHRFETSYKGDPYGIFLKMYAVNPAPFSAYLNFDDFQIISNSPERFILVQENAIETRPIKGTIARGKTKKEDESQKEKLINSKKDDAELSMIVDLLRNDLGKVCEIGSVKVDEHKKIEGFKNVWQMLSIISGTLREEENYGSLLKACFPGGSITGCPKIRSMEIIDELEEFTRNLYTGSIFIANNQRFDSNIAIRTVIAHKNKLYYGAGVAIVYDSDPNKEYEETLIKAKTFNSILQ